MLSDVSPYALLSASKPRPAEGVITPYDLYSQSQQLQRCEPESPPAPQSLPIDPSPQAAPSRRTHYIADIQSRHSAANQRACSWKTPPR